MNRKQRSKLQRAIQYCMLVLVLTCSILLSLSIGSFRLFLITLICGVAGFIVTDTFKWFRIGGWLANVASIAILVLAMSDFFGADSSGKLIAVANLLVYLQSILMFQEKTPRLNWQILVLSLLQVVITTIFTVGFDSSYLLLVYFSVAGLAMVLQCLYVDEVDITRRNRSIARQLPTASQTTSQSARTIRTGLRPENAVLVFDAPRFRYRELWHPMLQLMTWIIAGLAITIMIFFMAPRKHKPLFQSISFKVAATGFTNKVDLNETGKITQSNRVVFRSSFTNPRNDQPLQLGGTPYFRSMALGSLKIEDGHTTWTAPFDRLQKSCYRSLLRARHGHQVKMTTTLQPNTSPQLYSPMPASQTINTSGEVQFCHEISTLTRCRYGGKVSSIPFKYELGITVDRRNAPLMSWPFDNPDRYSRGQPMADNSLRKRWLTALDRSRYPTLVEVADRIASEVEAEDGTRQQLIERLNRWFSANRFKYTLDYREVKRDNTLDTVEDFFRNHRSGHCEMYASALTLMLRSQDIPARLVVGFVGNEYNERTKSYVVREKHAHAWVEAYLSPSDCTSEMFNAGLAGNGGAWLIVDPNPQEVLSTDSDDINDPIEMARTVWQDIVLGIDDEEEGNSMNDTSGVYRFFSFTTRKTENAIITMRQLPSDPRFLLSIVGLFAAFTLWKVLRSYGKTDPTIKSGQKISFLRRVVASAAGLLSTNLESWVLSSGQSQTTEFYGNMERLLEKHGLQRAPTETHRQFADTASQSFVDHPAQDQIGRLIHHLTERFNAIRFGDKDVTLEEEDQLRLDLARLTELTQLANATPTTSPS